MNKLILSFFLIFFSLFQTTNLAKSATELRLNPNLNYHSDSDDGPLIYAKDLNNAKLSDKKPNHIIFYHRECYNSKRQARRTVELYNKHGDKINFIIIDVDNVNNRDQKNLLNKFYSRYIPHITIINNKGKVLYNKSGEVSIGHLSDILMNMETDS